MCHCVSSWIFERVLVENRTRDGGLGGPGGRHLHHAAPRALAVEGGAREEAVVQLWGHPVTEDAWETGDREPEINVFSSQLNAPFLICNTLLRSMGVQSFTKSLFFCNSFNMWLFQIFQIYV